jgi:predicted MPP superfamily phosphohydrolase
MAKNAETIRWLHLSDFHVGKDDYATRKMFDYILAHVRQRKEDGFAPDLLFITGDLADRGLVSQYETIWQNFILPLQQEIGGDIEQRTFVVPGNHDVDRLNHPAFSREEIAKPESHYLDPTDEGAKLRGEMLIPRFRAYLDNDLTPVSDAFSKPGGAYAECLTIHAQEVGIVGINTAWLSKGDKDERQLTPGKPLLETALNAIQPAKLRIVLGHHPIDWFIPAQQKPIKSLLGQHHVLYLHGHLHDAWCEPSYGGGQGYLVIQAGASFQAREGEPWRNGLVWGEADLNALEVRLQPWRWIPDQQAWTPATDAFHERHRRGEWWHYPLPSDQPAKVDDTPVTPVVQPPKGWSVFKPDGLAVHLQPLDEGAALRYFDGAVPDWPTALSTSIPRRHIVGNLVGRFRQADTAGRSIVTLLLAAGCEGKTTALLQAAYAVIQGKDDWRILQRRDESQPLVPDEILPVLVEDYTWLLLLDETDRAAGDLHALLMRLPQALHGRVHVLLACRDTDWLASQADDLDWSAAADFYKERLIGLDSTDAQAIVQSWQTFGKVGLGDLAEKPEAERAAILERQAKDEAATQSGAFFGALLAVRSGSDLRKHARLLLDRLGQRKIPGGATLRDALAYIAAMHAEGLEFLSRPVLVQALGCPANKLHREVLVPLGQEAAATTTSSFILTRHRRIAETLVSVLEEEFGKDVGALYVDLGIAAIDAALAGHFIPPNLGVWRFKFSEHFLAQGWQELAFNIAHCVLDRDQTNSLLRTHVANLYRRANLPEQAIQVFRGSPNTIRGDLRSYHYEWGVAEGECDHQADSALLEAYSLSDQCEARRVDNNRAKTSLAGLGVAFGALHEAYHNPDFRNARMAVAVLGLPLRLDSTTKGYFDRHAREAADQGAHPPELDQAIPLLQAGIAAAELVGVDAKISELLPKAEKMTFKGLEELTLHFAHFKNTSR